MKHIQFSQLLTLEPKVQYASAAARWLVRPLQFSATLICSRFDSATCVAPFCRTKICGVCMWSLTHSLLTLLQKQIQSAHASCFMLNDSYLCCTSVLSLPSPSSTLVETEPLHEISTLVPSNQRALFLFATRCMRFSSSDGRLADQWLVC